MYDELIPLMRSCVEAVKVNAKLPEDKGLLEGVCRCAILVAGYIATKDGTNFDQAILEVGVADFSAEDRETARAIINNAISAFES